MGGVVVDGQVRRLLRLLASGESLSAAAARTGMDRKTARRYRELQQLPSESRRPRTWRTRADAFAEVWPEVEAQLEQAPGLQAKTLFEWLQRSYPGRFQDGQLRVFQRRVKSWRATRGPAKEVFFRQVHPPGRLCASDFTHMAELKVTIGGVAFDHRVYHFVLTYSNWESATICFSESFASLSEGLQNALWQLGGVPARHRTDRLSAAVNNLSDQQEFTRRYQALLGHYGLTSERIQAGKAHENGDVESLHGGFKQAVDQALLLRGSREFVSREEYAAFLQELVKQRNAGRRERLAEEFPALQALPPRRWEGRQRLRVRVACGSVIRVKGNTYSVDSRLIGETVEVWVHAECLEVWYGQRVIERLPRLPGRNRHRINYRHVIDWLVRKPGAFAHYCYRDDLFPTSRFRMAYDVLQRVAGHRAEQEYLQILHLAARESESAVDAALRVLLDGDVPLSFAAVRTFVEREQEIPAPTDVFVEATDLTSFDSLFTDREVCDGPNDGCEFGVDGAPEGIASADDAADVRSAGAESRAGDALVRAVSAGVGACGV